MRRQLIRADASTCFVTTSLVARTFDSKAQAGGCRYKRLAQQWFHFGQYALHHAQALFKVCRLCSTDIPITGCKRDAILFQGLLSLSNYPTVYWQAGRLEEAAHAAHAAEGRADQLQLAALQLAIAHERGDEHSAPAAHCRAGSSFVECVQACISASCCMTSY